MALIGSLPAELVSMICHGIPLSDRISLSSTSSQCRAVYMPTILRSVTLQTRKSSTAGSFLRIIEQHGHHVKELRVVVPAPRCDLLDCDRCADDSVKLWHVAETPLERRRRGMPSNGALALLRGDHDAQLPNLRHIAVEFPSNFGQHLPMCDHDFVSTFGPNRAVKAEHAGRWFPVHYHLALRVEVVLNALSYRKAGGTIKHLTIANLPPPPPEDMYDRGSPDWHYQARRRISAFTPRTRPLLSSLERFDLSLWAGDEDLQHTSGMLGMNRWWRQYSDCWQYTEFVDSLAQRFFDHLHAVKHVRFECSLHAIMGQVDNRGYMERRLPLISEKSPLGTMPLLERLELVNIVVAQPLLEFVETRAGHAPLALKLQNTRAYVRPNNRFEEANRHRTWAAMLNGLRSISSRKIGPRLRSFERTEREEVMSIEPTDFKTPPLRYAYMFPMQDKDSFFRGTCLFDALWAWPKVREADEEAEARLKEAIALFNGR